MADVSAQLKDTYDMIERGKYFIINRPGYLLIFDHNKKKTWKKDWVTANGKRIFWAKV